MIKFSHFHWVSLETQSLLSLHISWSTSLSLKQKSLLIAIYMGKILLFYAYPQFSQSSLDFIHIQQIIEFMNLFSMCTNFSFMAFLIYSLFEF